jgi:hypothetical protein
MFDKNAFFTKVIIIIIIIIIMTDINLEFLFFTSSPIMNHYLLEIRFKKFEQQKLFNSKVLTNEYEFYFKKDNEFKVLYK